MNAYADLKTLKSSAYLNIAATDMDTQLRKLLEFASREIDQLCGRFFYCWEGIRYYDSAGLAVFFGDDILSISAFETDEDGDGVYENAFAATDYLLCPRNALPKLRAEIAGGAYGGFGASAKITGVFGYGDGISAAPYADSGIATAEELDASETGIDVAAGGGATFSAGQTIRIESEQAYIQSIVTDTLTVRRGMNGTAGATHATGKAIYIYEYPAPIAQACLILAMRAWKRKDTGYADVISSPELGQTAMWKGLDPDVAKIVGHYKKWGY